MLLPRATTVSLVVITLKWLVDIGLVIFDSGRRVELLVVRGECSETVLADDLDARDVDDVSGLLIVVCVELALGLDEVMCREIDRMCTVKNQQCQLVYGKRTSRLTCNPRDVEA